MPLHFCVLHTVLFVPCYVQRYVRHLFDMYKNKNEKFFDSAEKNESKNDKENRKNADGNEKKMKDEKIKSVEISDENLNGTFLVKTVRTSHLDEDIGCIERERNHEGKEVIVGTSVSIILHILSYLFVMFVLQYNCLDHLFLLSDNRSGFVSLF